MPPAATTARPPALVSQDHEHREGHAHSHDHAHDHAHSEGHGHSRGHSHSHGHSHAHSHAPGQQHPAARPAWSLLRLSAGQRLALVLPLAGLLWAMTLWVIWGGSPS